MKIEHGLGFKSCRILVNLDFMILLKPDLDFVIFVKRLRNFRFSF